MKVPFYSNTPDDTHCVQACFKMILKYFLPEKEFSFEELDKLSKKEEDKGTWIFPIETELSKMGFEIVNIEEFDYLKFQEKGKDYLYEIYDQEQADWYLQRSNLLNVKELIPEFLDKVELQIRKADLKDFERLLAQDFLLVTDINAEVLNGNSGFTSHSVLIYEDLEDSFMLHDPGLPPAESRKVSKELLLKAGADNLSAFKY